MKKYLLGAAAALALAAPGVASANSGYADLSYTNTDFGSGDADTTALGGAYSWGGDGTVGFQIDGVLGQHEFTGGDVDTYNLGAHAFVRNEGHLIGGFVNFGNTDFGGGSEYDYYTLGAEGAVYMSRTTLSGVLSWSDSEDLDNSVTALDLGLTHFVTDNFSIGGNLGFGEFDAGSDFIAYGLGGEYQFASFPVSLYGGWNTTDFDGFEVDALTLGVRYNFGGSLFDRDRSGASLSRNGGFGRLGGIL
ncbi:MAG TPA: hypothetical protein VEA80_14945 [Vitreimonas sp.]|uniref:hypothetical protein n=1 Tax=Vitreimonas sp. TaxID=3069702 RepID=UPI002D5AC59F|nr:hypothetical protein [Vitreimonas sp.]HYD88770.1 hypothetical protein [Vitreimonas sp.]